MLNKGNGAIKNQKLLSDGFKQTELEKEDIEETEYSEVLNTTKKSSTKDKVFDIFNDNDGKITLLETRLKANSKRDYGIRLTLIYLYYQLIKGKDLVPRNELTPVIQDASVYDGNYRHWILNTNLVGVHDDNVELKAPGREKAKDIIEEIYDSNKEDKWKLGTTGKKRKKKEEEETEKND